MQTLIVFLGIQLSGKSSLAKKISEIKKIHSLSIDSVRFALYHRLSGPKDWSTPRLKEIHDHETKEAYDHFFRIIKANLLSGSSLVVEMPHLGDREETLTSLAERSNTRLKIIWCYIAQDSDKEINRRIEERSKGSSSAVVRLEDYRMFKAKIKKPTINHLLLDTSQSIESCIEQIDEYLKK